MSPPKRSSPIRDRFGAQLAKKRAQLSPGHLKVADYIDGHRHRVLGLSALEIGFETGASDATVIRAIQSLGFSGLIELKDVLEAWLGKVESPVEQMAETMRNVEGHVGHALDFVLHATSTAAETLKSAENVQALSAITRLLAGADAVGFFGLGSSGIIAEYGARLFTRSGIPGYALNATGIALAEQLLALRKGHVLVMMLHGRAHREAMATIAAAESLQIPIVMMLGKADSPLRNHAVEVLVIPRTKGDHVQLHAPSLIAIELLHVTCSAMKPAAAVESLERLVELRTLIRPVGK